VARGHGSFSLSGRLEAANRKNPWSPLQADKINLRLGLLGVLTPDTLLQTFVGVRRPRGVALPGSLCSQQTIDGPDQVCPRCHHDVFCRHFPSLALAHNSRTRVKSQTRVPRTSQVDFPDPPGDPERPGRGQHGWTPPENAGGSTPPTRVWVHGFVLGLIFQSFWVRPVSLDISQPIVAKMRTTPNEHFGSDRFVGGMLLGD